MNWTIIRTRLKLGLRRIVLTRTAFLFFLIAFLSGVAQLGAVTYSFHIDAVAQDLVLDSLVKNQAGLNDSIVATVTHREENGGVFVVRLCGQIYDPVDPHPCDFIPLFPNATADEGTCRKALNYPYQLLDLAQREDVFNIAINTWMLFVAIYALMTESIPHLGAYIMGKTLTTIWTVWTVIRLPRFVQQFGFLIQGVCNGLDDGKLQFVATTFFQQTQAALFISCAINLISICIEGYVAWRLASSYARKTYTLVCAPVKLIGKYKLVLALDATVQLGLFFFLASSALWLDRLHSRPIIGWAKHPILYQAEFWTSLVAVPFWILIGWYGVRRETRLLMALYLLIGFILLVSWSVIFYSIIYRWYFITWAFWAGITIASMLLLIVILVLSILVWRNFGDGVGHWLHVSRELAAQNFKPSMFDTDPKNPEVEYDLRTRRPSSLYQAKLKRLSNGLSSPADFKAKEWDDPFIDPIPAVKDVEKGEAKGKR